jgi:hypothetical protein
MTKQNSTKKVCIECCSSIPIDAKKCINCNSFQDWRRHFNFSSVILSLTVAMLTSLALIFQIGKEAVIEPDSNISVCVYPSKKLSYCLISNNIFSSKDSFPNSSIPILERFKSFHLKVDTNNHITMEKYVIDTSLNYVEKSFIFSINGKIVATNSGTKAGYIDNVRLDIQNEMFALYGEDYGLKDAASTWPNGSYFISKVQNKKIGIDEPSFFEFNITDNLYLLGFTDNSRKTFRKIPFNLYRREIELELSYVKVDFSGRQTNVKTKVKFPIRWYEYMNYEMASKFLDLTTGILNRSYYINIIDSIKFSTDSSKLYLSNKEGTTMILN